MRHTCCLCLQRIVLAYVFIIDFYRNSLWHTCFSPLHEKALAYVPFFYVLFIFDFLNFEVLRMWLQIEYRKSVLRVSNKLAILYV